LCYAGWAERVVQEGGKKMAENVTVADAIEQLRAQIEEAQRKGQKSNLRFLAKTVEIELGIVFKREIEGNAGVRAWFLDLSGKAKAGNEATHKIKLVLEPRGLNDEETYMSDKDHEKE
jgi:hypothetical protein